MSFLRKQEEGQLGACVNFHRDFFFPVYLQKYVSESILCCIHSPVFPFTLGNTFSADCLLEERGLWGIPKMIMYIERKYGGLKVQRKKLE